MPGGSRNDAQNVDGNDVLMERSVMMWLYPISRGLLAVKIVLFSFYVFWSPLSVFAQIVDKGEHVEVVKGTSLCSNITMEQAKGSLDPGRIFWKVTSRRRANGTQTISALIQEQVYDRLNGDTNTKEARYDEDYAIQFKRDPAHAGMIFLVSPQDGRIEATVEVCKKRVGRAYRE
jgi:hypothetical protein